MKKCQLLLFFSKANYMEETMSIYQEYRTRSLLAQLANEFPAEYRAIVSSYQIQAEHQIDALAEVLEGLRHNLIGE